MAENLNYGTLISVSDTARDNEVVEKYCLNDNRGQMAPTGGHYTYYDWMEMVRNPDSLYFKDAWLCHHQRGAF